MSRELSDLKNCLRLAEASLAGDLEDGQRHGSQSIFPSSEAAVQAILECLNNSEFSMAIRYTQECRWDMTPLEGDKTLLCSIDFYILFINFCKLNFDSLFIYFILFLVLLLLLF